MGSIYQTDKTVVKFVPASGAASRMFKNLFEFLGAEYDVRSRTLRKHSSGKSGSSLSMTTSNAACLKTTGKDIPALIAAGNYKAVVAAPARIGRIELRRASERIAEVS